jgi:L-methionine (R)-S-oxide reductase
MHINPERSARPDYTLLLRQVASILEGERDLTANAAQFSALVYDTIADLNWAGFYLAVPAKSGAGQDLLVGPFQGKPACARIPFGRGVCGAAALERRTIVVPDVHAFAGHIACDSASNSEIVIPLIKDGVLVGVFDIDSPRLDRFSDDDRAGLEAMLAAFLDATDCAGQGGHPAPTH